MLGVQRLPLSRHELLANTQQRGKEEEAPGRPLHPPPRPTLIGTGPLLGVMPLRPYGQNVTSRPSEELTGRGHSCQPTLKELLKLKPAPQTPPPEGSRYQNW